MASTTFQTESNFTSEKNISESGILVMTLFGGLMSVVSMYTSIALSTQLIKKNKARKKASKKILTHRIRGNEKLFQCKARSSAYTAVLDSNLVKRDF